MIVRLTPQQRIRLAQNLRKQLQLPGLSERQRQAKRRHIWNLMKINEIDAIRRNRGYAAGMSSAKEQDSSDTPKGPSPLSSRDSDMLSPSEIERLRRNSKETQELATTAFQKDEKPTSDPD